MNLFITGGTGFLGRGVLSRVGHDPKYEKVYVLIRGTSRQTAEERLHELFAEIFPPADQARMQKKIVAVQGDLTLDHLGLSVQDHFNLQFSINEILHVGASTDFGAPLLESRAYNVEGTRRVLELAELCRANGSLQRFDYVSTAFVAGTKRGVVTELDTNRGQKFANNYEQTKWESENLVRTYATRFPVAIFRPSIVVGDSRTGFTPHFKVLYWPLRLLSKNVLPFIPCQPRATLDVVPVDFVVDALLALTATKESLGGTWHLTAGRGNELRIGQLLRDAQEHAGIRPRPTLPIWLFDFMKSSPFNRLMPKEFWQACELAAPYYFYLRGCDVYFDASRTHLLLAKLGVKTPTWASYKNAVLSFCRDSAWGKRLPQPKYWYYAQKSA